jgi:hypothetical protein
MMPDHDLERFKLTPEGATGARRWDDAGAKAHACRRQGQMERHLWPVEGA